MNLFVYAETENQQRKNGNQSVKQQDGALKLDRVAGWTYENHCIRIHKQIQEHLNCTEECEGNAKAAQKDTQPVNHAIQQVQKRRIVDVFGNSKMGLYGGH